MRFSIVTLVSALYRLFHPTVPHEITDMSVRIRSSHFHPFLRARNSRVSVIRLSLQLSSMQI